MQGTEAPRAIRTPGVLQMLRQAQQGNVIGADYNNDELKELGPSYCHTCWLVKLARLPRYQTISESHPAHQEATGVPPPPEEGAA